MVGTTFIKIKNIKTGTNKPPDHKASLEKRDFAFLGALLPDLP
jgi:hypothetical protein